MTPLMFICMTSAVLLPLSSYAHEINTDEFDRLVVAEGYQVVVKPSGQNKIKIPTSVNNFTYALDGKELIIGNRELPDGVKKNYTVEVYTSTPLSDIKATTQADVLLLPQSYNNRMLYLKVSTFAHLNVLGEAENVNLKSSTGGVFGEKSNFSITSLNADATTHSIACDS